MKISGAGFLWTTSSPVTIASNDVYGRLILAEIALGLAVVGAGSQGYFLTCSPAEIEKIVHTRQRVQLAADDLQIDVVGAFFDVVYVDREVVFLSHAADVAVFSGPDERKKVLAWDVSAHLSILSGDLAGNDVLAEDPCDYVEDPEDGIWSRPGSWCLLIESTRRENSVHIVTAVDAVGAAVLEGFSLTGGNAYWPPHWWTWDAPTTCKNEDYGGALFHQGMAVTLRACTFFGNSSICLGGAVCSLDSSWLVRRTAGLRRTTRTGQEVLCTAKRLPSWS